MRDCVNYIVRDEDEGDGYEGLGNFGRDEGSGGCVCDRKHRLHYILI